MSSKLDKEEQASVNRTTVRLGRRFAGSIAVRLDAHPTSAEGQKVAEERRIIALAKETLAMKDPDPTTMNFLSQAVEMHTKVHGYSKRIHDELFRLHEARARRGKVSREKRRRKPKTDKFDLSRFLAGPKKV